MVNLGNIRGMLEGCLGWLSRFAISKLNSSIFGRDSGRWDAVCCKTGSSFGDNGTDSETIYESGIVKPNFKTKSVGILGTKQRGLSSVALRTHHWRVFNWCAIWGTSWSKNPPISWVDLLIVNPSLWKQPFTHDFDLYINFLSLVVFTRIKPFPKSIPQTRPRYASPVSPFTTKLCTMFRCLMKVHIPKFRLFLSST